MSLVNLICCFFYWIQSQTVHRKNTYTKTIETKNHVVPQQQQERRFPTPPNQITEFLIKISLGLMTVGGLDELWTNVFVMTPIIQSIPEIE
jgi:hypothetical protein